jgi:hypothetical protein
MSTYRFRQWLANVPIISLPLLKMCQSDSGGSVVHAQWRWTKCRPEKQARQVLRIDG